MTTTNPALVYKKVPRGLPAPGQDVAIEDVQMPSDVPHGGLRVQVLYSSLDPYLRGLLRDPEIKSYFPAADIDAPIKTFSLAKVVKSNSDRFKEGDIIRGVMPTQRHLALSSEDIKSLEKIDADPNDSSLDFRHWLGALGMPGLTAYSSFFEIGKPQRGETIFISSAAGAVGQVVGQLAKHEGLRVIGSVGSDEKVKFVTEQLGFDAAFNYKRESPSDALDRLAPDGINIYFENVGAEHLTAAIDHMNTFGRIIACGMIAEYNKEAKSYYGHKNLMQIVGKQLTMRGFLVLEDPSLGPKYEKQHIQDVQKWLRQGTFTANLHEWDMSEGDQGLVSVLTGANFGKAILKVS